MNKYYKGIIAVLIILVVLFVISAFEEKDENVKTITTETTETSETADEVTNVEDNLTQEQTMDTQNDNGLKIEVITGGTGAVAENGQTVSVHYTGVFEDGTKFDSSVDRGVPFEFVLGAGMVIKGWDQGVLGMKVGEKRKLTIPSDLAYGPNDYGPIPGGSTLIFDVELLGVK